MSNSSTNSGEVEKVLEGSGTQAEMNAEIGSAQGAVSSRVGEELEETGKGADQGELCDDGKNEEEADEGKRLEKVLKENESDGRNESDASESYGATSSSRSFVFARPESLACVQKKVRRASCQCQPSTSTAAPQCHEDDDENGESGEEREESLMSSKFFDDTVDDWMKLPPKPANEALRKAMRRQSLCHNLPYMTEEEAFVFFKPSDFFDLSDQYSTDSSSTMNESEASYWRRFEAHEARQAKKRIFMALSKEEKRMACQERTKRVVMKREYSRVYHMAYEDTDYIRKPPKRRRVGKEESAEDDWDVEDRLMRKRSGSERKRQGLEYEDLEPAVKRLNKFVEFVVVPVEEEEDQIVEEQDLEGVEAQIELAAVGVEQRVAAVEAVDDDSVEMEDAATEQSDERDDEPLDQSIGSDDDMSSASSTATAIPLRRSQRVRKPVDRWTYPVDHIPRRRRYVRRDAMVQMARPVRRPLPRPTPAPVVIVKQPRQPPLASRGAPALPAPAPATTIAASHKVVMFDEIGAELDECRKAAAAADFGVAGLEVAIKIARIASSCASFRKKNSVPSPMQMERILKGLGKLRSMLGMI